MRTPDITRAQLAALLTFIGGQAVAWGWLSGHSEQLVVATASTVIAAVWKLADAWIRHGRSKAAAVQMLEQLLLDRQAAQQPPPAPHTGT